MKEKVTPKVIVSNTLFKFTFKKNLGFIDNFTISKDVSNFHVNKIDVLIYFYIKN